MKENIIIIAQADFRNRSFFDDNMSQLFPDLDNIHFQIPAFSNLYLMMRQNRIGRSNFNQFLLRINDELAFMEESYKKRYFPNGYSDKLEKTSEFSLRELGNKIVLFSDDKNEEINYVENLARQQNLEIIKIPIIIEELTEEIKKILEENIDLLITQEEILESIKKNEKHLNIARNNMHWEIAAKLRDRIWILKEKL